MSEPAPASASKGCLRVIVATLVLLAAGAVLVEQWVGRWSWPVDEAWYRVTEVDGVVTVGCQNFAPVQFTAEAAPGVTRVLVVGGSSTFGFPARPTGTEPILRARHGFVGAMQAALDETIPGRVERVNLGVNGGASDFAWGRWLDGLGHGGGG